MTAEKRIAVSLAVVIGGERRIDSRIRKNIADVTIILSAEDDLALDSGYIPGSNSGAPLP
jgi:hypothetical protein